MTKIHSITHPNKLIQQKVNYFADYYSFVVDQLGKNIDFEIPFNNKYTKYTDTNVELPFDIYYKTPKKKKIFLPKWFTLIVTHKDFVIELLTRNINNNIDDPIRDDKLIKSILK